MYHDSSKSNPWRMEELSMLIPCPNCSGPRLKHTEAAGEDVIDGSQARLYRCPDCEKPWWIYVRVVRGLPVLIASAP